MVFTVISFLHGCTAPAPANDPRIESQEANRRAFGDFELPRKIGFVENVGLQLPMASPDGEQLLYLRTDQEGLSPMTLLGSGVAEDTPEHGTLSLWLRPMRGTAPGRRVSRPRWSHSATWSASSERIAFVSNEPPYTSIQWVDIRSGDSQTLGVPRAVNSLPRFAGDDQTLLFCAAPQASGPARIYRQVAGSEPTVLSPEGADCVLPALLEPDGAVICAQVNGLELSWVRARPDRIEQLADRVGDGQRPAMLQVWAGLSRPTSPDGRSLMFYDGLQDRIGVFHLGEQVIRRHRVGSVAACWLTDQAIALATAQGLFAVDTSTVVSHPLLSGSWVPLHYVPDRRELILLGRDGSGARFSIVTMQFRPPTRPEVPRRGENPQDRSPS